MPRPGPRRPTMTIRISEAGLAMIATAMQRWSKRSGKRANRSEVVRKAVIYGLQHDPDLQ